MNPIRAATWGVEGLDAAVERCKACWDYRVVEAGAVTAVQARAWAAPASAGRRRALLQPASGAPVFLQLVEAPRVAGYLPLRSPGWAALELCVQDVHAVHERLQGGPFEIIGPPQPISSLPEIHPMQVQGPDGEIVYLTEIKRGGPGSGLPTPAAPIDTLFIVVLACTDMAACAAWFAQQLPLVPDVPVAIPYRMLNRAFGLPAGTPHRLCTARMHGEIFLELDQLPPQATPRPGLPGELPPGLALVTLEVPDLDAVPGPWLSLPQPREGALYGGRRAGTLRGPEGWLLDLVQA
jgi:hypothetical protein